MNVSCAALSERTSFSSYIHLLREIAGDDWTVSALRPCQLEICSALWGTGNPDISGIGVSKKPLATTIAIDSRQVIIAYSMELLLAVLLAVGVTLWNPSEQTRCISNSVHKAYDVFADAAVLFTGSIQLACVIILVRKDFGISAGGMGGLTVEVTWNAALLTMLPTTLLCFVPAKLKRRQLRFGIVCILLAFFVYTFLSRMIANFGPSQISNADGAVITPSNWTIIQDLCFANQPQLQLSCSETITFDVFAIGGSVFVSFSLVGILLWAVLMQQAAELGERWGKSPLLKQLQGEKFHLFLIFNVFVWGVPQIWAILKFRDMQQTLATSIGGEDSDNGWSFGQIISVAVFLPVFIEVIYTHSVEEDE